jgi:hypothetical protein
MIIGFMSLVAGFVFLLGDSQGLTDAGISEGTATTYGWVELIFGVITVLIAIGLWNGAGWARLVVTALMAVRIIGSIWIAFALSGHGGFLVGVIAGGLAVIVLLLLWNGRSDAFFNAT